MARLPIPGSAGKVDLFTGGDPTGGTDSSAALDTFCSNLSTTGGGICLLPANSTYLVSVQPSTGNTRCLTAYPNVIIRGMSRTTSKIKLMANGQPNALPQNAMFASDLVANQDVGGWGLENLTVDQNAQNNPAPAIPNSPHFIVNIGNGSSPVTIRDVDFININGVNSLYLSTNHQVIVERCRFVVNPNPIATLFDCSIIYWSAAPGATSSYVGFVCRHNTFEGTTGAAIGLVRSFADAVITKESPILTSAALGTFTQADVGRIITAPGIPNETRVFSVQSSISLTMSANANISGTVTANLINAGKVGAGCAIETHGPNQLIDGNIAVNMGGVLNATGISRFATNNNITITNNKGIGVNYGINCNAQSFQGNVVVQGVNISNNTFELELDVWSTQRGAGLVHSRGIYVLADTPIYDLTISGNLIWNRAWTVNPSGNDKAGIGIYVDTPDGITGQRNRHRGWSITNNKIERMMGPGILSMCLVDALTIADNVIINCALAPVPAVYKFGIIIQSDGVGCTVSRNQIADTNATPTITGGISYAALNNGHNLSNISHFGNIVTTTNGTVVEVGYDTSTSVRNPDRESNIDGFECMALSPAYLVVNFNNYNADSAFYLGAYRYSGGVQNDQIVWRLPQQLRAGTWTIALVYATATTFGIYTISTSIDGKTWTAQGTIDGYAVASSPFNRTELTSLTIPAGMRWVRLQIATKNASSTGYSARFSALYGTRTNV